MDCIQLRETHLDQACEIMRLNYEAERAKTKELPEIISTPDLGYFVKNAYALGMIEGDTLIGYLCAYPPIEDAFGTAGVKGTFIPVHAHGAIGNRRKKVYDLLYQGLAKRLVEDRVFSHAIALYAHDQDAIDCFFTNGFGMRCMDSIRAIDAERPIRPAKVEIAELDRNESASILPLRNGLIRHLSHSPTFLKYPMMSDQQLMHSIQRRDSRIFIARNESGIIAYIEVMADGENFITENEGMLNICGAYCLPEFRKSGIVDELLAFLEHTLHQEGIPLLGVDFESFNPTAREFWGKHFTPYTVSLVRRIDEKQ
ncbi:MAG TPA: hypothetical protein DCQ90_07010 [Erysipelotrichaceae bacterium]|nr:hypothetical protein [Erysipelotrichaceae bacterium]